MPPDRDVEAFDQRAASYDAGWLGRLHHEIADRTAALVRAVAPSPERVLDIGCGTGYLLRSIAEQCPEAIELIGIDPAPAMIQIAESVTRDDRLRFSVGVAERLSARDGAFDLVVSTTSFDHWSDQRAGLKECVRVLRSGGHLVLVDQFSPWMMPTLLFSRHGKVRTTRRCTALLREAGCQSAEWHRLYATIIKAVVAPV